MASQSEKMVLLFSNGQSVMGKENTLSHFSGAIPEDFLKSHKNWRVSLNSCGLHLNLKQKICSKNDAHPAIIYISYKDFKLASNKYPSATMENLSLDMFKQHHKLYVNSERPYSAKSLVQYLRAGMLKHLVKNKSDWCGFPLKYKSGCIQFGQFNFDVDFENLSSKEEKLEYRTFVFLNKYFKKHLQLKLPNGEKLKTTHIDGERYFYWFNSPHWKNVKHYPFKSMKQKFPLNKPKVIQVICPQVESSIFNNGYRQCIKQFAISHSDVGTYVQREFDDLEFFEVLSKNIDKFQLKFVDENFHQLRLRQGLPSHAKLIFNCIMRKELNVRVSSEPNCLYPQNNISDFSVQLPKMLDFTYKKNPKVALTRISLKNKWNLMPGLCLDFSLFDIESTELQYFDCVKTRGGPRNCQAIRDWFEKQISATGVISIGKQSNGALTIKFLKKSIAIISRDLSQCLGFSFVDKLLHNSSIKISKMEGVKTNFYFSDSKTKEDEELKKNIAIAVEAYQLKNIGVKTNIESFFASGHVALVGDEETELDLQYLPRNIELYPHSLYIYSNIVSPTAVIGEYKKLLRIVSLPHKKQNQTIAINFSRPDFLNLSELKLRLLQFQIVTSDGRTVSPFDLAECVYMNLQFVHN